MAHIRLKRARSILIFTIWATAALGTPLIASAKDILDISKGLPLNEGKYLPPETFAPVVTKRLKNSSEIWMNWDLLRSRGYEFPAAGLTPEYAAKVDQALGWAVPLPGDAVTDFGTAEKTFYADRYGGTGIGYNFGTGRTGSAGEVQLKGIGPTALLGFKPDTTMHGEVNMREGIGESIWGEVNHHELPVPANRNFAVLDKGLTIQLPGKLLHRTIMVRDDFELLRIGHFVAVNNPAEPGATADKLRMSAVMKYLAQALPVPAGHSAEPTGQQVSEGFNELMRRMAHRNAREYAAGFLFGATSHSNLGINGGALDYGTQSAQPVFGKIRALDHIAPFGDIEGYTEVLGDLSANIKKIAPAEIATHLPDANAIKAAFAARYQSYLNSEMLALTGIPPEIVSKIAATPNGKALGELLIRLSKEGTEPVNVVKVMPTKLSTYDVRKILVALGTAPQATPAMQTQALREFSITPELHQQLITAYRNFVTDAKTQGVKEGIAPAAFDRYVTRKVQLINRTPEDLYRPNMDKVNTELVDNFFNAPTPAAKKSAQQAIARSIDDRVTRSLRYRQNVDPYTVVLGETRSPLDGETVRRIYDAKTDRFYVSYRSEVNADGTVHLLDKRVPLTSIAGAAVQDATGNHSIAHDTKSVHFRVETTESGISRFKLLNAQGAPLVAGLGDANLAHSLNPPILVKPEVRGLPAGRAAPALAAAPTAAPAAASCAKTLGAIRAGIRSLF